MNSEKKYVQMIISIDEHFFMTANSNFNICFRLILIRYDHDIFQILYFWPSMVNVNTGMYNTFYNLRVVGNFLKHFPFINQFAITSKVALCRSIKYSILVSSHISSKSSWLKILSDRARIFLKSSWNRCPATFITGQSLSKASKKYSFKT